VRLNKYLADHGVASRRACDELISAGKIIVDGLPETRLGTKVDPNRQTVEVDGVFLKPEGTSRRYYILNKPSGVVCTNERRETRLRAVDLISDPARGRVYTVGRLDEESKGLILITNDGEFAQRIAHPRFGVPKIYAVKVVGNIDEGAVQKVRGGVHLSEGRTGGARIVVIRRTRAYSYLEVTLREGINREVRRIFARVGYKVVDLKRVQIGPLNDRGLKVGRWRSLSRPEVEELLEWSDPQSPVSTAGWTDGDDGREKHAPRPRRKLGRRAAGGAGGQRPARHAGRGQGSRPGGKRGPGGAPGPGNRGGARRVGGRSAEPKRQKRGR
jgi:23S rRNA pseudouridine2605 synthase